MSPIAITVSEAVRLTDVRRSGEEELVQARRPRVGPMIGGQVPAASDG